MAIIKAHCNECAGERNHDVLHTVNLPWEVDEYGIIGSDT